MKNITTLALLLATATTCSAGVTLEGPIGTLMGQSIDNRLYSDFARTTVYDEAVHSFETHWDDAVEKNGGRHAGWQNEYWGKMMLCYAGGIAATGDPELKRWALDKAHAFIQRFQKPNGYLSTYGEEDFIGVRSPDDDLTKAQHWNFNIWGRKYTMWALIDLYRVTGDRACLDAAVRMADHLCAQLKRLNTSIEYTGSWAGLSPMTILKPLLLVYQAQPKPEYLALAKHIVTVTDRAPNDPKRLHMNIIHDALTDRPIHSWFDKRPLWLAKAYELMSFFEGVAEYHKVTGDARALAAVKAFHRHLMNEELNPMRSAGFFDHFLGARRHNNGMTELCDAIHWMRLNSALYRLTHETAYLDCFEEAFYNSFLAGISPDGSWGAHIIRSHGTRHLAAPPQTGMVYHQCCPDNLLRGFFDWTDTIVTAGNDGALEVNLFSDAHVKTDKAEVTLAGNYPVGDAVRLTVNVAQPTKVRVRVPAWSKTACVDGAPRTAENGRIDLMAQAGATTWKIGFDMTPRILPSTAPYDEDITSIFGYTDFRKPNYTERFMSWMTPEMVGMARNMHAAQIMRGPLVLAKGRLAGTSKGETLGFDTIDGFNWTIGSFKPATRSTANMAPWGVWTLELCRGNERRYIPVADFWSVSCVNDPENWFSLWF